MIITKTCSICHREIDVREFLEKDRTRKRWFSSLV